MAPGYAQQHFPVEERRGRLRLLVSPDGRDGSISSHQDGLLYGTLREAGASVKHELNPGRRGYVHVARGSMVVHGQGLRTGDGAIENEATIATEGIEGAEVLLFDLP